MQLKMISAQPATDYYAWQVEVYLDHFLSLGYNHDDIHVVAGYEEEGIPESWNRLVEKYKDVQIFLYEDTAGAIDYPPAVQSHLLEKHFKAHPYLSDHAIFFHDADFLFTKYFDFTSFLNDDKWYFSDTISYIGADYIKSKHEGILDIMCSTIGIDRSIVEANQKNSGGAQKLMKNIDHNYWREVFEGSLKLYDILKKVSHIKKPGDSMGIQIWTASMWAELWIAWKKGHEVVVPKEFDFCWATCNISRWDDVSFFHNAGVVNASTGLFYKADYIDKYPFKDNIDVNQLHCSKKYWDIVKSTDSCLI